MDVEPEGRPSGPGDRAGPAAARRRGPGHARALGALRPRAGPRRAAEASDLYWTRAASSSPRRPSCRRSTGSSRRSSTRPSSPTRSAATHTRRRCAARGPASAHPTHGRARSRRGRRSSAGRYARHLLRGELRRGAEREIEVPLSMASEEERLGEKRFEELEPDELDRIRRLMCELELADAAAPPRRRRRAAGRAARPAPNPASSLRTGGDPMTWPGAAGAPGHGDWC